jgi:hypothetical protein
LFAGVAAFAFAAGTAALAFASAGADVLALASDVLALASDVLAFASDVLAFASVFAGLSDGISGLLLKTETFPVNAGIASSNADNINTEAAPIVILERTVAVPRGLNAELDTLLVKRAPASVLPGCSKTADTRTMQDRKNNPYKK